MIRTLGESFGKLMDTAGEFSTALLTRLGLKPEANSQNQLKQVDDRTPTMHIIHGFNPLPCGKAKPTTGLSC
jgi:hypothetical protein